MTEDPSSREHPIPGQTALDAAADLFRQVVEAAPDALVIVNESGEIVLANSRLRDMLGYDPAEIRGEAVEILVPESHRGRHVHHRRLFFRNLALRSMASGLQLSARRKDGTEIPVDISLSSFESSSGTLVIGCIRDVTARRMSEVDLEMQASFDALLIELSARLIDAPASDIDREIGSGLCLIVDHLGLDRSTLGQRLERELEFRITHSFASGGVEPLSGTFTEERFPWLIPKLARGETVVIGSLADLPAEAQVDSNRIRSLGVRSSIVVPLMVGGDLVGALGFEMLREERRWSQSLVSRLKLLGEILANALARRRADEQLQSRGLELSHAARVSLIGELTAALAHELNQPLSAILMTARAMKRLLGSSTETEKAVDRDLREALEEIGDDAIRAGEIIHRLRGLMRKGEIAMEPLDIDWAISEVESIARADARHNDVDLVFELTPDLPPVRGDRIQLQQVVLNLIRNGSEAMEGCAAGKLVVRTKLEEPDTVKIEVEDAGPPVDDETFGRFFEPFFTSKQSGMGLGLSVSQSIVETHGGRLWATRNTNRGITMHLTLPVNG